MSLERRLPGCDPALASGRPVALLVHLRVAVLALLPALLCGCSVAHYFVNKPLHASQFHAGYAIRNLPGDDNNSDSLSVLVAMSGGGYRAAALAYSVLEVLNETPIVWEGRRRTFLDEVDFVSGVSGGSLTAAYLATSRENFFPGFEDKVLRQDLQQKFVQKVLSPATLWAIGSKRYGRGDVLQEVLDEEVFKGATFAQVSRRRPMVYVNATNIRHGERFEFTQDQFDLLCSDLSSFPVARAVAASMAVPLLFAPVTMWNHSAQCPIEVKTMPLASSAGASGFVHLADGGLADNTGVRMPLEIIAARGGLLEATRQSGFRGVKKRVFIVVNAQIRPDFSEDQSADTPGLLRQLRAAVDVPIDRYSVDSIGLLNAAVRQWKDELQRSKPELLEGLIDRDTAFHVIEVALLDVPAEGEFSGIRKMSTELRISDRELVLLKRFVRFSLARNAAWQGLLSELGSPPPGEPPGR